jgi:cytochrome c oxidase subunit 3
MTVSQLPQTKITPPPDVTANDNFGRDNTNNSSTHTILLFFLAMVTMLFAGFTSAYIIRMSAEDFKPIKMPPILWFNTLILLGSSFTYELSKILYKKAQTKAGRIFIVITFLGGCIFIAGQIFAFDALKKQGIFLSSNPHSSFFYLLCGTHLVHFLAGAVWLFYIVLKSITNEYILVHSSMLKLSSTYWHYFSIVWIYLLYLLFVFKIG